MVSVAGRATGPDRGGPGGLHGTSEDASRHESRGVIQSLTACPECGLPAEITERFLLASTDGPVEHLCLACVDGHYFRMPADSLSLEAGLLAGGSGVAVDVRRALSAASSGIGFSRLPGALGTVANADSGTQHF
ncbi:MAG TPA: hypothetical protein VKB62_04285 [Streptosporangiaceae bacterium]|nr:hypothetical protein [Streptosporangiaceae bacterium]